MYVFYIRCPQEGPQRYCLPLNNQVLLFLSLQLALDLLNNFSYRQPCVTGEKYMVVSPSHLSPGAAVIFIILIDSRILIFLRPGPLHVTPLRAHAAEFDSLRHPYRRPPPHLSDSDFLTSSLSHWTTCLFIKGKAGLRSLFTHKTSQPGSNLIGTHETIQRYDWYVFYRSASHSLTATL